MASLQERSGSYRVLFSYHGKLHAFTIGKVRKAEAEAKVKQVDYLLMRLKQRLAAVPDGVDIVNFIQFDGKPPNTGPSQPDKPRQVASMSHLKDRYLATHSNGTIEANSLATVAMHLRHFAVHLGDGFPLHELTLAILQDYLNKRVKSGISPTTIRKEIASFRAAWNWGHSMHLTDGRFPNKGLRFPKTDEKPPFATMAEIQRHIAAGASSSSLWECLYLTNSEIDELLSFVKENADYPWIYPLFVFAAHTGARRSELLRALVSDVDFAGNTVLIREKKRTRGERSMRRVPLTPLLRESLQDWLKVHPPGSQLFCHDGHVARSKKRSRTTGHLGEKARPSSGKGRSASVRKRNEPGTSALTRSEVHDHFKRVLQGSKWEVIRGLHCLRHSFISACASKGIDQRLIDEWVGHSTEQQRRRYRHLYPSTQQAAIKSVFE